MTCLRAIFYVSPPTCDPFAFANAGREEIDGNRKLQVVEVDFAKPQPGKKLEFFWKPARELISRKVQECAWMIKIYLVPRYPFYIATFVSNSAILNRAK
jgi:hypothetical protein